MEQRGAAAVAAMRGSIEREDVHQLETFAQLKTIRQLLQAYARWAETSFDFARGPRNSPASFVLWRHPCKPSLS